MPDEPGNGLPAWLIGTWTPFEIHQNDHSHYLPGDDPEHWYPGVPLTITADRLSFFDFACQGPKVSRQRGSLAALMVKWASGPIGHYGLPRETKPVDYLEVSCAQTLADRGDGTGATHDVHSSDTWYIVVRSSTEIEMPYYHFSYVKFRKAAPTS